MSTIDTAGGQGQRTLARGLRLLEAIVAADGSSTAKSLARQLGVRPSTCYEMLKTLEIAGYVTRTTGGYYEVGPAVPAMFRRLRGTLSPGPRVSTALRTLRDETGETSYACALRSSGILLQEVLEGRRALVVRMLEPGVRANVHARASCRAILAHLPEAERRHLLPARALPKLTEYTITDRRTLRTELASVVEQGYAVERNEYQLGVGCLAAPFFDRTGSVAGSLAVSMPVARLSEDERGIGSIVMSCAQAAGYPQVQTNANAA
jgi:IclR family acetate operon transcriptional repressor